MFKNLLKRNAAISTPNESPTGGFKPVDARTNAAPVALEAFQSHWRQALGVIKKISDRHK